MTPPKRPAAKPRPTQSSTFYLDDSGVKAGGGRILVVGGIKLRAHGRFMRELRHIRDQSGFSGEFKWTELNKGSVSAYYAMIDALVESDAHLVACVTHRPANAGWRFYGNVAAGVVHGNINKGEVAALMMDQVSTPRHVALDDYVRVNVNKRVGSMALASVATLDSKTSDGLQVADFIAGAIAFERRREEGESGKRTSMKGRVADRLKAAFDLADLNDCRTGRVNIHSWASSPRLRVVKEDQEAS